MMKLEKAPVDNIQYIKELVKCLNDNTFRYYKFIAPADSCVRMHHIMKYTAIGHRRKLIKEMVFDKIEDAIECLELLKKQEVTKKQLLS